MPRPVQPGQRYVPGLDGIRALAVIAVIAYHLNLAPGGNLGVGVFFTLSGYLITDLLLEHWQDHGTLGLRRFWLRRARRLLPALFLMLALVSVYVALFDAAALGQVRRQVISAAFYFANWSTIAQHGSYFSRFAAPLPLDHLWSLSIEEQFYLLWPWLLLVGIWALRRRLLLALLVLVGGAVSAWLMGHLYHPGYDPTRAYEGTDTRAFGLLVGAALAIVWPAGSASGRRRSRFGAALDLAGAVSIAGIIALIAWTNSFSAFLYPWGFVLLSVATAVVLAATVLPSSVLGTGLGWSPLRWIGVRSYGIYLWQWPIIVLANPGATTLSFGRALAAVAGTVLAAALSWRFVEEPFRRGALRSRWRQLRSGAVRVPARSRVLAYSATASTCALAVAVVLSLSGALPVASSGAAPGAGKVKRLRTLPVASVTPRTRSTQGSSSSVAAARRTSCRSVVYIGDSTSEGEVSSDYIPDPRRRLTSQLARVGVQTTIPEISGARSIVETYQGQPDAATVAQGHISGGFHGCWILALGTNDVDNVHDGGIPGFSGRIARMMSLIGRQPVLWVNVVTVLASGPYSESAMQRWNRALMGACARFPTMRVFDWAAWVKPRWFIPDGIHYYSPGYVARTHLIAKALAAAFPQGAAPSASCLVR